MPDDPKPATEKPWWFDESKSPAENAFDPSQALTSLGEEVDRIGDAEGLTVAERTALSRQIVFGVRELEISDRDRNAIVQLVGDERRRPPTEEQLEAWNTQSRRQIRERYGAVEGERLLTAARKFVAGNGKFRTMIAGSALGSHPRVIEAVVEHIRRTNYQ